MYKKLWLRVEAKPCRRFHEDREPYWEYKGSDVYVNKPSLNANQIAVGIELNIPDALFNRPSFTLKLDVPEPSTEGPVVDANTSQELAQMIQEQIGVKVVIEEASNV